MAIVDITGNKYNRLTVISFSHSNKGTFWNVKCDCGNELKVNGAMLKNGHTKSCGCYRKEKLVNRTTKHKLCNTPTYTTWDSMIQRCSNKHNQNYHRYGERGIKVCDKWLKFECFIEEMGLRPPSFTLDRIDNNKGYYKENCRWVNQKMQANNTSKNVNITYNGETHTVSEWAEKLNISRSTLNNRLFRSKWTIEKSLTRRVNK